MTRNTSGNGKLRVAIAAIWVVAVGLTVAAPALADFPYARPGANTSNYSDLFINGATPKPNDVGNDDDGEYFKYSASPLAANALNNGLAAEMTGIRGGRIYDENGALPTAWQLTTGRPDVTIATLDSGIRWNSAGAMNDLRLKTRINKLEVPRPQGCASYDCNGDNVFNVKDYEFANDSRVMSIVNGPDPRRDGPPGVVTPQDILIAFSGASFSGDGRSGRVDDDGNGYVDDVVGWDYMDNDNDPFDDVDYGHGTGEAEGSSAEVNNGNTTGSCANCMVIHMRVGDSFVADVSRFAAAVTYAADNDVQVVQSALGALNNSSVAREAVDYAYRHGTTMIVSAADEAAQHNNQPSLPHTILVNSVTRSPVPAPNQSFLAFNGCTNFSAKITLAIESTSCSSDAVGVGSGMAGLVYSAAYNAFQNNRMGRHGDRDACETVQPKTVGGDTDTACIITPNEVRQLMASGRIPGIHAGPGAGSQNRQSEDVNFISPSGGPEPACAPIAIAGCTGPYGSGNSIKTILNSPAGRPTVLGGPVVAESYPARRGTDQFYGYGRANTRTATEALLASGPTAKIPPEAEIQSPEWFEQVDPGAANVAIEGEVYARDQNYTCEVLVAPGQYPNQNLASNTGPTGPGDFRRVSGGYCDGTTVHSGTDADTLHSGVLSSVSMATLKSYFPAATAFDGAQPEASAATSNGRPGQAPNSFTFKVVVTSGGISGEDQRSAYLHRDADMLPGFPRTISEPQKNNAPDFPTGDGESSPAFADIDGDNRNELVYGSSDGFVHAVTYNPTTGAAQELPGWPVRGDPPSYLADHADAPAFDGGEVSDAYGGAMLAAVAISDADANGLPEVYAADLEGKVYGWDHTGDRVFTEESDRRFSGAPIEPFRRVREGETNRTQHGFIGSPVLADLDLDGDQELIAGGMDKHVYAWQTNDSNPDAPGGAAQVSGFPTLVVDRAKVDSIDPQTHRITFEGDSGSQQQGGIIDTPAVADLDGDANETGADELPEIIVGTNEGYAGDSEPGPNTSVFTNPSFAAAAGTGLIEPGNARVYALKSTGDADGDPNTGDAIVGYNDDPAAREWPVSLAFLNANLLPIVGEGVTGYPVVGPANCPMGGSGPKVGVISYAGPGYILNKDGTSCYGETGGTYNTLATDQGAGAEAVDRPIIPAVGHPAFGNLTGTGNPSFVVPAAGLVRALDLVLPEYQPTGQDYISAYDTSTGQFRPNFPQTQNDLSFLTGPSISDIDGLPGEEVVSASASMDFNAYTSAGTAVLGWPKLSSDWVVANPLVGSFGTLDTAADAEKVVIGMTRSGYLTAYSTSGPACSPASWPRFHHDNANSGDYSRDAVLPGKPMDFAAASGNLTLKAPGDDLLCGTATKYELRTSNSPITEQNFKASTPLTGAPATPAAAGAGESFAVPAGAQRYVAIRAVDEQDNVGRVASLDLQPSSGGGGGNGGGGSTGGGSTDGGGTGGGTTGGGTTGGGTTGGGSAGPDCQAVIDGTDGKDKLRGTAGSDRIRALAGKDKVRAAESNDCVNAGPDGDNVRGDDGDDRIGGDDGPDRLAGDDGDDRITGGDDPDRIKGGDGDDRIRANGDGTRDRIDCGDGNDTVFADERDSVKNCERVK